MTCDVVGGLAALQSGVAVCEFSKAIPTSGSYCMFSLSRDRAWSSRVACLVSELPLVVNERRATRASLLAITHPSRTSASEAPKPEASAVTNLTRLPRNAWTTRHPSVKRLRYLTSPYLLTPLDLIDLGVEWSRHAVEALQTWSPTHHASKYEAKAQV